MPRFVIRITLFLLLPFILKAQTLQEFRAVKITNVDSDILFSDAKIASGMDYLASIGINTVLVVVWNGSGTTGDCTLYPSALMDSLFGIPIHPAFSGRDPLKRIITEAHRNGMEVLPWFEMGFATSYSQNGGHIISRFPDWALKDRDGKLVVKNGFDWMSAINPEVQDFIIGLTTEVLDTYDVDGIEYSDRIPAMPVEGGYDSATVSIYRQEHDGSSPPYEFGDPAWKRWRADKLTGFYQRARDSIKVRGSHLIVSSSPSIYPWSYEEYLQDSKTWVEAGIADNIIPQLYRYSYSEYVYELNKSLNNFPGYRDIYYAGMLIYLKDDFLITPDSLLRAIQANRDQNVNGEAFFFYEGLRANNNLLGDTLKATFYREKASVPDRKGLIWRPRPVVVNEDDPTVEMSDGWISYETIPGFRGGCYYADGSNEESINYRVDIPYNAWYGIYVYGITHWNATRSAQFVIYGNDGSDTVSVDQRSNSNRGWYKLKDVYLESCTGYRLLRMSNAQDRDHLIFADAVMLMLDRQRSADLIVTGMNDSFAEGSAPRHFELMQNYPNPFNSLTAIGYRLRTAGTVVLDIYNVLGQHVVTLVNGKQDPGSYTCHWNALNHPSGIYFVRIRAADTNPAFCGLKPSAFNQTRKMVLIK